MKQFSLHCIDFTFPLLLSLKLNSYKTIVLSNPVKGKIQNSQEDFVTTVFDTDACEFVYRNLYRPRLFVYPQAAISLNFPKIMNDKEIGLIYPYLYRNIAIVRINRIKASTARLRAALGISDPTTKKICTLLAINRLG